MPSPKQVALAKARARRVALDEDRAARDRRVEDVTADVLVLLEERAAAEAVARQVSARIGEALRKLLDAEGITVEGVGQLCDLPTNEVRRLARAAGTAGTPPTGTTSVAAAVGLAGAAPADKLAASDPPARLTVAMTAAQAQPVIGLVSRGPCVV